MKFPKIKKKSKKKDSDKTCFNCKFRFSYYGKKCRCPYPDKKFHIVDCDKFELDSLYKSI